MTRITTSKCQSPCSGASGVNVDLFSLPPPFSFERKLDMV